MNMKKTVYCEKCGREITNRDDLVVSNIFLSIVPYHEKCFSRELKGLSAIFVGNETINGNMGNVTAIVAVVLGIISLFFQELRYITVISFLFLCLRFYSWFKYERYL
jgi:hypothetical protein